MIFGKGVKKCLALTLAAAFACMLTLPVFAADSTARAAYENKLFGTGENLKINIITDSDKFRDMLDNAINEEYYKCDVEIDGEKFTDAAIRAKGNTSLSSIVSDPDSDRYSFKIEFDHYDSGKSCYGLDKLVLNNNYADATNMKEYFVYRCFEYLGGTAPLTNYAEISVNGEYWGVYLAVEAVEESFLRRNYGTDYGALYKPDSMEIGGGGAPSDMNNGEGFPGMPPDRGDGRSENAQNNPDMPPPDMGNGTAENAQNNLPPAPPDMTSDTADSTQNTFPGDRPEMGGAMGAGSGSDLNYSDDATNSYSAIWDGEVTKTDETDHKRVVTALKNISESNDLENYLNTDNVLKYMAAHTFAVNLDSLSGNMAHNYYLYEKNGRLDIIPWDYNLSFGGMNGDNASDVINFPIDTPFDCTDFFDALLENEEYLEKYHGYLKELSEGYILSGAFEREYAEILSRISEPVQNDPTAFYTYDEFTAAAEMLRKTVKRRAESVIGQIRGVIPSTKTDRQENSSALLSASDIDISVMGTMTHGNQGGFQQAGGEDKAEPAKSLEVGVTFGGRQPGENSKASEIAVLGICGAVAAAGLLFGALYKRR